LLIVFAFLVHGNLDSGFPDADSPFTPIMAEVLHNVHRTRLLEEIDQHFSLSAVITQDVRISRMNQNTKCTDV